MSVFEDIHEIWQNALEHDDVVTVTGPTSIETLLKERSRFEQLDNEPRDGCLVISIEVAREFPKGWIAKDSIAPVPLPQEHHKQFDPFEEIITVTERIDGCEAFICRSDAVRLDMEILKPDGVVAIDFDRGESTDG